MTAEPNWGLVATIKAKADEILRFAAYHIELGAHRLYIYLDEPCDAAFARLKAHPKIRVMQCDDAWWRKRVGKRPAKHQVRQTINATHAYKRRVEVDWMIHMDVDEFLWPSRPVPELLASVPWTTMTARVRPAELLADGDGSAYKRHIPSGPDRDALVDRLYPRFGRYVKGGFLSHVAGKIFVRSDGDGAELRIHNAFFHGQMNPGEVALDGVTLLHRHAHSWTDWQTRFAFRLERGSYRADLPPARPSETAMSLHELLAGIAERDGEAGLRAFFDEVCADSPDLRERLGAEGQLLRAELDLDSPLGRVFPSS